jgi:hypothetical protein
MIKDETQCILDRYNLTRLSIAYYYYSCYGVFPVVENLYYQYSTFIKANTLTLNSGEFALIQSYAGSSPSTFTFGSLTYDVVVQNDHTGLLLDRVNSSAGFFMIHVFKYV